MHRFYLPPSRCHGPNLSLTDREAHHAAHVLRLRPADQIVVLDGAGHHFHCQITNVHHHQVDLAVLHQHDFPPPPCPLALFQALPKPKAFDLILQKATELGAARILPLLSERSIPHLDSPHAAQRRQKWLLTAVEALKQSGAPWLPAIDQPTSIPNALPHANDFELHLLASLHPQSQRPRPCLRQFIAQHQRLPTGIAVWIGPEGDFTPPELDLIRPSGALPVTLGPAVLRVETAAIYCLSILHYELSAPEPHPLD